MMMVSVYQCFMGHLCKIKHKIMKTQNQTISQAQLSKQALRTYGALAFIVYSFALAYCYFTDHFFEMGLVGAVMLGLGILILNVYLSIDVKSEKHETENSFMHATQ